MFFSHGNRQEKFKPYGIKAIVLFAYVERAFSGGEKSSQKQCAGTYGFGLLCVHAFQLRFPFSLVAFGKSYYRGSDNFGLYSLLFEYHSACAGAAGIS
jgi:hypothetical protein